jgi:hypothetical protein
MGTNVCLASGLLPLRKKNDKPLINDTMTTHDLGMFTSPNGYKFEGYWQPSTGLVYLKLQHSALRTSLVEAGTATQEEEARAMAAACVQQVHMTWA